MFYRDNVFADAETIAAAVLEAFDRLPAKYKPRSVSGPSGISEWVPLAGVVAEDIRDDNHKIKCIALATGMKCLPEATLDRAGGKVLHDSHAEVLVLRSLNRLLLEQCLSLVEGQEQHLSTDDLLVEKVLPMDDPPEHIAPFRIRDTIRLHMYCSECPCGDASMELVMSRQVDATPWSSAPLPTTGEGAAQLLGRGHFDQLGVVRRKPSRPDAPITSSKSCTDKLSLRQYISILSGLCSLFIEPQNAYVCHVIIPESDHTQRSIERAFGPSGRMAQVASWPERSGYAYRPFRVSTTTRLFSFSRHNESKSGTARKPSNISCIHFGGTKEVLINGAIQGRKQGDPRGASKVSRRSMWILAKTVAERLRAPHIEIILGQQTYGLVKAHEHLHARREAKARLIEHVLPVWSRNSADSSWGLAAEGLKAT
ncbi:adenosine deaminase/editase [Elsinoe ampelina]|uniref:Adenosine deaminase/editase n=1 Tax=Elsinoe ampelina TaxID=302913 RepID=A0A6A6GK62_9PEZI|nr:adenosine deaminase/editase [Elsinoe ampelina]